MERRLAAVLIADVVGYSRLMGRDEAATLATLRGHLDDVIRPRIDAHGGRVVKLMGDAVLAEFPSVVEAVECAVEIQKGIADHNAEVPEDRRLAFRIGVNIGDVVVEGDDIYGDGVNVAARLEALAEPGGICIRRAVRNEVRDKLPYAYDDLGAIQVKNIARPVHAFHVRFDGSAPSGQPAPRRNWRAIAQIAAATVILLFAIALGWWLATGTEGGRDSVPSIAVLPFTNLSPDPDQEYFADGLTDDLINDLAKISSLAVIARNSVFTYKGVPVKVQEVGRDLGVRYVLEGSVRRAGGMVRINVQLADTETGRQIWAERYDRDQSAIFAVQDAVIAEIVNALAVTLTKGEHERLTRVPTKNLEAYDAYLRAESIGIHTTDPIAMRQTLSHYRRAIELDPGFAEAHAGYARVNAEVWRLDFTPVESPSVARKRAYDAASRALTLDPNNARAYTVLALMQLIDKRHEEAIASARSAVALAPSDPEAHAHLAYVLAYAGRAEASLDAIAAALRLGPRPTESLRVLAGAVYFTAGDYDATIEILEHAGKDGPASEPGQVFLIAALARVGRLERARERLQINFDEFPSVNWKYFELLYDFYRSPEDRDDFLDALAKAGMPEWPHGFQGRPEDRVTGEDLRNLVIRQTWSGKHHEGLDFFQYVDGKGRLIYRSANSLLTGTAFLEDDTLCYWSEGHAVDKNVCGAVYRNRDGGKLPYVYVGPYDLRYFSTAN